MAAAKEAPAQTAAQVQRGLKRVRVEIIAKRAIHTKGGSMMPGWVCEMNEAEAAFYLKRKEVKKTDAKLTSQAEISEALKDNESPAG